MPYLGDYIGHLFSEITLGRMQADMESVRVAEMYATHPLLRYMPVPRFRLPTMTMDVPVVIQEMEEAPVGEPPGGIVLSALRTCFGLLLTQYLQRTQITLEPAVRTSLDLSLDQVMATYAPPEPPPGSVLAVADALVAVVTTALGPTEAGPGIVEAEKLAELTGELREAARREFVSMREAPPRLVVQVLTSELRDAGPSDLLARLHLSISENAVEWVVTESQGKSRTKLVPE